jgi:hypothetical protein
VPFLKWHNEILTRCPHRSQITNRDVTHNFSPSDVTDHSQFNLKSRPNNSRPIMAPWLMPRHPLLPTHFWDGSSLRFIFVSTPRSKSSQFLSPHIITGNVYPCTTAGKSKLNRIFKINSYAPKILYFHSFNFYLLKIWLCTSNISSSPITAFNNCNIYYKMYYSILNIRYNI